MDVPPDQELSLKRHIHQYDCCYVEKKEQLYRDT